MKDVIDHPAHYNAHPAGIECIDVVEELGFNVGNAMKYLWRQGLKGDRREDLEKARWYVSREIERLDKNAEKTRLATAATRRTEGARKAAVTRKRNQQRAARAKARKARR